VTRPHNVCRRCAIRHSPKCPEPRWPLHPLLKALGDRNPYETFHVNAETIRHYALNGVPEFTVDRWCNRIGLHPAQVYGWEWVSEGLSVLDEQFLAGGWRQAWEFRDRTNATEEAAA